MATLRSVIPTIRVTDVAASLPLYRALGFEIAWQHRLGEDAPRLTAVARDSGQLFLTEHPVAPVGAVVHFMVEGLDGTLARARDAGFEPTFGPEQRPWGDREAYFTDADGNVLRFGETVGAHHPVPGASGADVAAAREEIDLLEGLNRRRFPARVILTGFALSLILAVTEGSVGWGLASGGFFAAFLAWMISPVQRFARIAELRRRLSEAEGAPTALPKKESGDG
jgi:catechol 2,3-dioxygenase-like lactoylglutathione lyase family enzyme